MESWVGWVGQTLWHTSYESPPEIQRSFLWVWWQADNNQCNVFGSWALWSLRGYNPTGPICDHLYGLPWVVESVFMRWNQAILSDEGNEKVQDSLPICFGHPKELSAALADPSTISGLPWSARHNILPGQLEKLSSMSSLPRQEWPDEQMISLVETHPQ